MMRPSGEHSPERCIIADFPRLTPRLSYSPLPPIYASSFRKIRFFALSCKNADLCGIRFVFLDTKKLNRIPDKRAFCEEQKARFPE
jgi:hypothetical protein